MKLPTVAPLDRAATPSALPSRAPATGSQDRSGDQPRSDWEPTRRESALSPQAARRDHALASGAVLEGFRIVRVLGAGGFGIVYLAWDIALERHVAVKEYMPSALAYRSDSLSTVVIRTERDRDTFELGRRSFVNEARLLARFDHPALLKVHRFWEGNGTAYMAMPYYQGQTLSATLAGLSAAPDERQLRRWLRAILDALDVLHAEQCYHRDISPDNILITPGGPVLLDFGSAREVINDRTQALTAMVKPGYAPIEQYGGELSQGPWTDLYALAGVVHYAIVGQAPPASVTRVIKDGLVPLARSHSGRYGTDLLRAVDSALALRPEARPRTIAAFRELLGPDPKLKRARPPAPAPVVRPGRASRPRWTAGLLAVAMLLLTLAGAAAWWTWRDRSEATASPATPAASTPAAAPTPPPTTTTTTTQTPTARIPAPVPVPVPVPAQSRSTSPQAPAVTPPLAAPARTVVPPTAVAPRSTASTVPAALPSQSQSQSTRPPAVAAGSSTTERSDSAAPTPTRRADPRPARCGDIIQKSSLEPLTTDEVAYLKKECR